MKDIITLPPNIIDNFRNDFDFYGFEYEPDDLEVKWVVDAVSFSFDPDTITEVYFFHNGTKDEESWNVVGKLQSGLYFYFESSCDDTGFDCQGWANVVLAKEWSSLVEYGLDEDVRHELYKPRSMQYINLTPHDIGIQLLDGNMRVISPSGIVARCEESTEIYSKHDGITVVNKSYTGASVLPDKQENTSLLN